MSVRSGSTLDKLLARISSGEDIPSSTLVPYLACESREERAQVNTRLARAYFESGRAPNLEHARTFVDRAWLLSRFSRDLLPLYTEIHVALDDIARIQAAYKRLGMLAAARGDTSSALEYFDLWQRAYPTFKGVGRYAYDVDVLDAVDRLASAHRFPARKHVVPSGRPIRIAYLAKGITELGSVLIRINLVFAKHHDRSRFEPMFFVPESERAVRESDAGKEHRQLFEEHGDRVVTSPDVDPAERRLLATARAIHDFGADMLVTSAALAEFGHYFVTALRPAPLVVALVQGPAPQFAPPSADWGIAWSRQFALECPVGCSHVPMELDVPAVTPASRDDLRVPPDAPLLTSAGRPVKLQDGQFWRVVSDLLVAHTEAYYLVLGAEEHQVPLVGEVVEPAVRERIRFRGWQGGGEYLESLAAADVLLDTFPAGGGAVLTDAMALGIPVVSFPNDYMKKFQEADWSAADDLMDIPELIAPRGDFEELKRIVGELIDDESLRDELARRCRDHVLQTRSNPERSVRRCEEVYVQVLKGGKPAAVPILEERWQGRGSRRVAAALRLTASAIDRLTWLTNGGARAMRLGARKLERKARS